MAPVSDELTRWQDYNLGTGNAPYINAALYTQMDAFTNTGTSGNISNRYNAIGISKGAWGAVNAGGSTPGPQFKTLQSLASPSGIQPKHVSLIPWETQKTNMKLRITLQHAGINLDDGDTAKVRVMIFRSARRLWNGMLPFTSQMGAPIGSGTQGGQSGIYVQPQLIGGDPNTFPIASVTPSGNPSALQAYQTELASKVWGGMPINGGVIFQADPYNDQLDGGINVATHTQSTTNQVLGQYITPYMEWPVKQYFYILHDKMVTMTNISPSSTMTIDLHDKQFWDILHQ